MCLPAAEYDWDKKTRQDFANGYIVWDGGSAEGYELDGSLLYPSPSINTTNGSALLTKVGAEYFKTRPNFYTAGNIFAKFQYGSSLVNRTGYTEGNCTWYAHGRVKELGGSSSALNSMRGNANTWHQNLTNGATIEHTPRIGDIAQWHRSGTNHVAVVEAVHANGTITISQSHYRTNRDGGGAGTLHEVKIISASEPDVFIRVPYLNNESSSKSYNSSQNSETTHTNNSKPIKDSGPSTTISNSVKNNKTITRSTSNIRFDVDNAALGTPFSGSGIDFDSQISVSREGEWKLPGNIKTKAKFSAKAGAYFFASSGTVDMGFSSNISATRHVDQSTGYSTIGVSGSSLDPENSYFSTYLGIGAGVNLNAELDLGLEFPLPFGGAKSIGGKISGGYDLNAVDIVAGKIVPGLKADIGIGLHANEQTRDFLRAEDTAYLGFDAAKLIGKNNPIFESILNLDMEVGIKQKSEAKINGFWFDPDSDSNNGNEFRISLEDGYKDKFLSFIPSFLRVRPDVTLETTFYAYAKGEAGVNVTGALSQRFSGKVPGLSAALKNFPLDINEYKETEYALATYTADIFSRDNWEEIRFA